MKVKPKVIQFILLFLLLGLTEADEGLTPGSQWWECYKGNKKIAYCHTNVVSQIDKGEGILYQIRQDWRHRFIWFGVEQDISSSILMRIDRELKPRYFCTITSLGKHQKKVEGKVNGRNIEITISSFGATYAMKVNLPDNAYFYETIGRLLVKEKLIAGNRYDFKVLNWETLQMEDLTWLVKEKTKISVLGEELICFFIEEDRDGINRLVWINERGKIVKEEVRGITKLYHRTNEGQATSFEPMADLTFHSRVKTSGLLPGTYRRKFSRIKLKGDNASKFIIEDERQRVLKRRQVAEVIVLTYDLRSVDFEMDKSLDLPIESEVFSEYLEESPYVWFKNKQIQKLSRDIAGEEKNAFRVVMKIAGWIHNTISHKSLAMALAPIDTMETKEGKCFDKAILFSALARSLGIPTKICLGIVYSKDGVFTYHAWNEVYVGQWVAVDPSSSQFPLSAIYLKLSEKQPEKSEQLAVEMAGLEVEISKLSEKQVEVSGLEVKISSFKVHIWLCIGVFISMFVFLWAWLVREEVK